MSLQLIDALSRINTWICRRIAPTLTTHIDTSGFTGHALPCGLHPLTVQLLKGGSTKLSNDCSTSSGGIKDVVIYCITKMPADNPKWIHPDFEAAKGNAVEFDQKNCVFLTHVLAVRSTQPVILKNSDSKGHNANIAAKGKALSANIIIAAGGSSNYTAGGESPEPFDVSCNIHPISVSR